jgi:hypothetical protein
MGRLFRRALSAFRRFFRLAAPQRIERAGRRISRVCAAGSLVSTQAARAWPRSSTSSASPRM